MLVDYILLFLISILQVVPKFVLSVSINIRTIFYRVTPDAQRSDLGLAPKATAELRALALLPRFILALTVKVSGRKLIAIPRLQP